MDEAELLDAVTQVGESIAKTLDGFCTHLGIVKSVVVEYGDGEGRLECEVQIYTHTGTDNEFTMTVPIVSGGGWGQSVIVVPEVNTEVEVSFMGGKIAHPYISKVKCPDYVMIDLGLIQARLDANTGEATIVVSSSGGEEKGRINVGQNGIVINGGSGKGLVLIDKLTQRLNDFEAQVKEFQSTFMSHIHTSGGSGAPTTTPTNATSTQFTQFRNSDYENTKITQG